MIAVRSVYALKSFATLEEAEAYAKKIQNGGGKHSYSELEIHWNPKPKPKGSLKGPSLSAALAAGPQTDEPETEGPWSVIVINEQTPPGAKPCAECETPFFGDDYLCPDCRENN